MYFTHEAGSSELGGRLNFVKFETQDFDQCIGLMRGLQQRHQQRNSNRPTELCVMATGGGAFKYYEKIKNAMDVEVSREDEMECLIVGMFCNLDPRENDH